MDLPADVVVLAMGPWTNVAASWLPGVPKIRGRLGHSVVIKPSLELSAHCFYLTHSSEPFSKPLKGCHIFVLGAMKSSRRFFYNTQK